MSYLLMSYLLIVKQNFLDAMHDLLFSYCVLVQAEYWLMLAADRFNAGISVLPCLQLTH